MSKFGAVGKLTPFLAAFALIIFFSFMHDAFLTWPNIWNIVRQSSVLLVAAMGITFVILIGSIDLSVGSIMTLSAICAVTLVPTMGEAGIVVGLLVGALCGAINGALNAVLKLPSFLVTLGTLFIFQSLGLIISGGRPLPWNTPLSSALAGGVAFGSFPKIGLWAVGVLVICTLVARFTRFGQYMYAIGDNERTTRMSGINTTKMKVLVFVAAGLISGLAGILLGIRTFSASPGMGDPFLLDTIAAVVLGGTLLTGGVGGPLRTVLGVLTIVILANGMTLLQVDPFYQVGIRGAVVILAVLVTTRRRRLDEVVK
ncbi:monosaccharide ABC transporter membrane protein (CUT2 family) [Rhizobium sp. ERR 922]|uniref:ABC transporter permease n=1 Tax=Rhizobium TaxID=379 RepID=UPI000DDE4365|nr:MULTISPECIES: ABC transporter permease [Rhizobium]TWB46226.1 monosaccharide ABC transporter membrane protein (CUT2 family) [Rhizobium sp. ERR 922]TWB90808.1 monosaccharide ABC transporter membrane protein (CUT2 family) [Rhizobium sp. ERR 942]GES46022.1 sugar ABC transporter permease [Rhizobium dioscoreae]